MAKILVLIALVAQVIFVRTDEFLPSTDWTKPGAIHVFATQVQSVTNSDESNDSGNPNGPLSYDGIFKGPAIASDSDFLSNVGDTFTEVKKETAESVAFDGFYEKTQQETKSELNANGYNYNPPNVLEHPPLTSDTLTMEPEPKPVTENVDDISMPTNVLEYPKKLEEFQNVPNSKKSAEEQIAEIKLAVERVSNCWNREFAALMAIINNDGSKPNETRRKREATSPLECTKFITRLLKHIHSNNEFENEAIENMLSVQEIAEKYGIKYDPNPTADPIPSVESAGQVHTPTEKVQDEVKVDEKKDKVSEQAENIYSSLSAPQETVLQSDQYSIKESTSTADQAPVELSSPNQGSSFYYYQIQDAEPNRYSDASHNTVTEKPIPQQETTPPPQQENIQENTASANHIHYTYNPTLSSYPTQSMATPLNENSQTFYVYDPATTYAAPVSTPLNVFLPHEHTPQSFTPVPMAAEQTAYHYSPQPFIVPASGMNQKSSPAPGMMTEEIEETVSTKLTNEKSNGSQKTKIRHSTTYTLTEPAPPAQGHKHHHPPANQKGIPEQVQYYLYLT